MRAGPKNIVVIAVMLIAAGFSQDARAQSKQILIGVKVEAEGGGKGQGMWSQDARDLTPKEVEDLQALVSAQLGKQPDVKIVSLDYPADIIGIVVVAAKLPNGRSGTWYIASSAITVSKKNGIDEFLTHDVFASGDLGFLARNIALQFAAARLRVALGPLQ